MLCCFTLIAISASLDVPTVIALPSACSPGSRSLLLSNRHLQVHALISRLSTRLCSCSASSSHVSYVMGIPE
ncbi:uncharacterized protein B0H18DRAFT_1022802 [Fomitopsis serialis]|uniref:uncharacterized protein n=1 Tax=Fomitopsis serialis TaxID=139415 RepID=UPI0020079FFC|nr:uncharacterized protein B0H18DRAFT_1022802 [Neoantrodia serialis]KAH9920937.1 hypothetical protein B0H18DRAFT_1022802 [Neoantrodia serialis]